LFSCSLSLLLSCSSFLYNQDGIVWSIPSFTTAMPMTMTTTPKTP
jgi:hypothetical protein